MLGERKEQVDIRAAGAICPMPDCGALVVTYHPVRAARRRTARWEFICPRCGSEFMAPKGDLIFQSVPRDWLLAGVCQA